MLFIVADDRYFATR